MKILFTAQAYQKFRAYIDSIDYEISGFGKIEKTKDSLIITDIKIFRQVVSAGHTEMDAQALAVFFNDLADAGEDLGKWKLWWHSHVWMEAFFSMTDTDTIAEFDSEMPEENWMMSIVSNKLGEYYAQINVYQPIPFTLKGLRFEVDQTVVEPISVREEIEKKVTIEGRNKISFPKDVRFCLVTLEKRKELAQRYLPIFEPSTTMPSIIDGEIVISVSGPSVFSKHVS